MKKSMCRCFFAAICAGMLLTREMLVYGATDEEIAAVREAQAKLQAEQNAHNEDVARENREAVEAETARKVAEQYAAMGIEQEERAVKDPAEESDIYENEKNADDSFLNNLKSDDAKEAWSNMFDNRLSGNVVNTKISGEIPEETLSVFFQALTVNGQPVGEVTFDELKELYPMNHAIFARKDRVKDRVRYGDEPAFFGFEFLGTWGDNILSVVYKDLNEEGYFTQLVLDAEPEIRKDNWWWRDFYDIYGDDGVKEFYNLGNDGFTKYVLKQECFSAEAFMELNGIETGGIKEDGKEDTAYFEYGEYTSEYGDVLLFYYHDKEDINSKLFLYFQEEDSVFDYIAVSDFRIEVKFK